MGEDKIQELLLQLVQDMSFLKAKLSNIEEQKLSSRIDNLEGQNREHERIIGSLEKRNALWGGDYLLTINIFNHKSFC